MEGTLKYSCPGRDIETRYGWLCIDGKRSTAVEWSHSNRQRTTLKDTMTERIGACVKHWQPTQ